MLPFKAISLDENVGPGLARQAGIDQSNGEFIMFADADDYFYPGALDYLLSKIESSDFDILFSAFRYERDDEVKIIGNDAAWLHGKIYRRDFLQKHNIHFNSYRANEDNGFNRLALLYKPRLAFDKTVTYVYSENDKSITRRNNREYKFTGLEFLAKNLVWAAEEYLDHCKDCDFGSVAALLYSLLLSMYYYYLEFFEEFEVAKILEWSKDGLSLFEKYKRYLKNDQKQTLLMAYDNEYPDAKKRLSFEEFLDKVRTA
jgi:glycosyltransferase involved in cell wall biosynthesis